MIKSMFTFKKANTNFELHAEWRGKESTEQRLERELDGVFILVACDEIANRYDVWDANVPPGEECVFFGVITHDWENRPGLREQLDIARREQEGAYA